MMEVIMGSKAATRLLLPLPRLPIIGSRKLMSTKASLSTPPSPNLQTPDVPRLAQTARISLTPQEVEEFGPKIRQVIDWFGQLQNVDLDNVEPAVRADAEGGHARQDTPETFDSKDAIITAIPGYEEPYIKVPAVLNKKE